MTLFAEGCRDVERGRYVVDEHANCSGSDRTSCPRHELALRSARPVLDLDQLDGFRRLHATLEGRIGEVDVA